MRNMNFRTPARREMMAESEMAMVRPMCLGQVTHANVMPIMTASMLRPMSVLIVFPEQALRCGDRVAPEFS